MPETSTLIPCDGKITRWSWQVCQRHPQQQRSIPIPHLAVVDESGRNLESPPDRRHRGGVRGIERWPWKCSASSISSRALMGAGSRLGSRNANNKRFRLSCTVGYRFVCHNLVFQGDYSPALAKHSN